mgnify:FL=1
MSIFIYFLFLYYYTAKFHVAGYMQYTPLSNDPAETFSMSLTWVKISLDERMTSSSPMCLDLPLRKRKRNGRKTSAAYFKRRESPAERKLHPRYCRICVYGRKNEPFQPYLNDNVCSDRIIGFLRLMLSCL